MTVDPHEYHRTFKMLRISGRQLGPADLAPDMDELKEARAKYRGLPDRQALDLLRADKARIPVHDAFEDTGRQYMPARIEEKSDQNFEKFATRWELVWSRLVMHWGSRLTPVVDSSGLVFAYLGDIDYQYFLIDYQGQSAPVTADTGMDHAEVLNQYRLFVGTNAFFGRTDLKPFGTSLLTSYRVVTDIHGEVMSYTVGERKDDSISTVGLLEIYDAYSFARAALGLLKSLGKAGLRTLVRRPPQLRLEAGRGSYTNKNPGATVNEQRIGRELNYEAEKGRLAGIKRVEGGVRPAQNVKGRKGDYDFFTNDGRSVKADLYEPSGGNANSIAAKIYEKSGQAEIVVVQLGRGASSGITVDQAQNIARSVVRTPGHGVRRVIVRWERQILADESRGMFSE